MKYKHYNNTKGMALIIVLILVGVIAIVALGFIVRGDTELAFGQNMEMKADMDYLAESGIAHGRGVLLAPQDVNTEYWAGATGCQLVSGSSDYYDVTVAKTSDLDFQIKSDAYRMQNGSKFATNSLTAKLRLDPAIAFWAGAGCRVYPAMTIGGDVYCEGSLENYGTINGDCFVDSLTGTVSGRTNAEAALTLAKLAISCNLLTSNFTTQTISGSNLSSTTLSGTPMVYYKDGDLEIKKNVKIAGALVVNGNLVISDIGNVITAKKNAPAIYVDGNLILKEGAGLTVNGLVFVDGKVDMAVIGQSMTINGVLFTDEGLRYILPDYSDSHYDGIVNGDCAGADGVLSGAVSFDGSGDYIDIGNPTNLNITSRITVAAWIRVNAFDKEYQAVITKGDSSWRLQRYGSTNNMQFACSGVTNGVIVSDTSLVANIWYHVVGVYEGNYIAIYINGSCDNWRLASGSISTNTSSVNIGENSEATGRYFNGRIDSVKVWNKGLSTAEILTLYLGGSPAPGELVGCWYMNTGGCSTIINAAPLKAAVWHWPSGVKDRWSPAAGAFYKSIVRNP